MLPKPQVAKIDELVQHFHEGMTQVEGLIKTQVGGCHARNETGHEGTKC